MQNSTFRVPMCHANSELIAQFAIESNHLNEYQRQNLLSQWTLRKEAMSNVTAYSEQPQFKILPKHLREFTDDWTPDDITIFQYGMIKSAINDVRDGRKSKQMQQEAREWLLSSETNNPLSFLNCCLSLGLDAQFLLYLVDKKTQGNLYF